MSTCATEDAIQEALIRGWRQLPKLREIAKFGRLAVPDPGLL